MNYIPIQAGRGHVLPISIEQAMGAQLGGHNLVAYPARKILHREYDMASDIFEIIAGHIMLTIGTAENPAAVVGILHPGDIVGLERNGKYFATAKTLSMVRLRKFSRDQADELTLQRISRQLCQNMQQHARTSSLDSLQRLAAFFLNWAQTVTGGNNHSGCEPADLHIPLQRAELASYLAMVGESMSRNLAKLRSLKVIETPDLSTVRILDFPRLSELAGGNA